VAIGRERGVSETVAVALTAFGLHTRRVRGAEQQEAAPLELFYDLVFVFAITQVSNLLVEDLSWAGAGDTLLALLVVWWAWDYTVWVTSEVHSDLTPVRLLMLGMMLASLAMAVAVPEAFGQHGLLFAGSYVAIKVGRLLFLTFDTSVAGANRAGRGRGLVIWFVPSGALWIAGGIAEGSARTGLWTAALALDLTGPMVMYWVPRRGRLPFGAWSTMTSHLAERFALFILIALGETIVLTGATTSKLELDVARFAAFTLAFLGTAALWWLYFDGFRRIAQRRLALASNPVQLARDAYMYLHVVLVAGVILSAVGDELVIARPTAVLTDAEVAVVAAGPTLYLLGQVLVRFRLMGWVYWERLGGAVACVLVGFIGTVVPGLALATILVAVLVVVIALDQVGGTRRRTRGAPSPFEQPEDSAVAVA
jgi:low temperature requirement protein LtrA